MNDVYDNLVELENKRNFTDNDLNIIIKNSSSADPEIRSLVAELLVNSNTQTAKDTLIKLTDDPDGLVRINACDSLGSFISEDVEKTLRKCAECDNDELVRAYSILSLSDIINCQHNSSEYISFFKKLLLEEKSKFVQTSLYAALYNMRCTEYLEVLIEQIYHKNYEIRCFALRVIINIINKENIDCIEKNINNLIENEKSIAVVSAIKDVYKNINKLKEHWI